MSNRDPHRAMRPSIRLKPSAELQAIIDRWAQELRLEGRPPALRAIKGCRP